MAFYRREPSVAAAAAGQPTLRSLKITIDILTPISHTIILEKNVSPKRNFSTLKPGGDFQHPLQPYDRSY